MHNRDLGPLGETVFKGWCHSVGLTVHKSEMDRTGWDFLVEFPQKHSTYLPRDMQSAPIECKIQVKATDKKERKLSIKVSVLNRLVKSPIPAFFCFIEFDKKNEAQAAYLVHVGQEIVERTLRRIRELEVKGKGHELHNSKITIHYGDSDRLDQMTGESLETTIKKYIPDTLEKYVENKNDLLENLGFENGKYLLNIKVVGKDPVMDMVDLTLGLRKEINIDSGTRYYNRFGLLLEDKLASDHTGAILSITPISFKAKLKFKIHKFSSGIAFDSNFYLSPLDPFLSKEHIKYRVESIFFEFIIEPYNGRMNFSFRPSEVQKSSLNELRNCLKALKLLKEEPNPLVIEIEPESEDLPSIAFPLDNNHYDIQDYSEIYQIAEMATDICHKFDIQDNKVCISFDDLIELEFSRDFQIIHYFLHGNPKEVAIEFKADEGESFKAKEGECHQNIKAAYTFFSKTNIGDQAIGCCSVILGSLMLVGEDEYKLVADEISIWQHLVATKSQSIDGEVIEKEFEKFEGKLQKEGVVVLGGSQYKIAN